MSVPSNKALKLTAPSMTERRSLAVLDGRLSAERGRAR